MGGHLPQRQAFAILKHAAVCKQYTVTHSHQIVLNKLDVSVDGTFLPTLSVAARFPSLGSNHTLKDHPCCLDVVHMSKVNYQKFGIEEA